MQGQALHPWQQNRSRTHPIPLDIFKQFFHADILVSVEYFTDVNIFSTEWFDILARGEHSLLQDPMNSVMAKLTGLQ